ncbi:MAG: hypothetical protein HZC40_22380 [Chloroflexi bacterium]|nr:hypothetical protein [Chloroflexota bacterium]
MPATNFSEYARAISACVNSLVTTGQAELVNLTIDQRSDVRGFIIGLLRFTNGAELHLREFVDLTQAEPRLMYAYHYQDANHNLIFRYDNAAHRPPLAQTEHKHISDQVIAFHAPTLTQVLDEIQE